MGKMEWNTIILFCGIVSSVCAINVISEVRKCNSKINQINEAMESKMNAMTKLQSLIVDKVITLANKLDSLKHAEISSNILHLQQTMESIKSYFSSASHFEHKLNPTTEQNNTIYIEIDESSNTTDTENYYVNSTTGT